MKNPLSHPLYHYNKLSAESKKEADWLREMLDETHGMRHVYVPHGDPTMYMGFRIARTR